MHRRAMTSIVTAALWLAAGCTERELADPSADDDGVIDPGEQPVGAGAMYSPCSVSEQCPDGLCVFPRGEGGFCSAPCTAPRDPGSCDPPPGDQPATCFDIGLPDDRWVCALDCTDAPCPAGMRCEQVSAGDGGRSICF